MTPIIDSIIFVSFGTAFGVTVSHHILVSLPLWWLLYQLRHMLLTMKTQLWKVANDNMVSNTPQIEGDSPKQIATDAPSPAPSPAATLASKGGRGRSRTPVRAKGKK